VKSISVKSKIVKMTGTELEISRFLMTDFQFSRFPTSL